MPELPEVETVRRGLEAALCGTVIQKVQLRRKNLRIPFPEDFALRLEGKTIKAIRRRAKYLLFDLSGGTVIIAHLGMTGRFSVVEATPETFETHDHVVMQLKDGRALIYNDARRFGLITLSDAADISSHALLANLGPEPFDDDFSAAYLKKQLGNRSTAVKVAIMDQALVVGVGNIYASEALFLARIHPETVADKAAAKAGKLITCIRKVLLDAIESGGSSLKDFVHVSGEAGYFQHRFNVYARAGKPCFQCGTSIGSTRLSGRSTFFCPQCQAK